MQYFSLTLKWLVKFNEYISVYMYIFLFNLCQLEIKIFNSIHFNSIDFQVFATLNSRDYLLIMGKIFFATFATVSYRNCFLLK